MRNTKTKKQPKTYADRMPEARTLAKRVFGDGVDTDTIHEIYDLLKESGADPDDLATDLMEASEAAKRACETTAPTPKDVMLAFDEMFLDE